MGKVIRKRQFDGLTLSLWMGLATPLYAQNSTPPSEYQVKAAFLLNFARFVEWPPAAFETPGSPFAICTLGQDPFGAGLDRIVEGETLNGRKMTVRREPRGNIPKGCQIVFIANSEKNVPGIIAALGAGVLTVGDGEGFIREGAMVAFITESRRVRFDVNLAAATKAGLIINARMLAVARLVRR